MTQKKRLHQVNFNFKLYYILKKLILKLLTEKNISLDVPKNLTDETPSKLEKMVIDKQTEDKMEQDNLEGKILT